MWVEFVVVSRPCFEGFPPFTKDKARCSERRRISGCRFCRCDTCDFYVNFVPLPAATSKRIQKPAAISALYYITARLLRNPLNLHHVTNVVKTPAISRRYISLKPYTRDLKLQLERDKSCIKPTLTKIT